MESSWAQQPSVSRHKIHPMLNGSPAPYSKPRGYKQTIRQEARAYKDAMHDWRAEQPAAVQKQVQLAPPADCCCACCASGAALGDDLFLLRLLGRGCIL